MIPLLFKISSASASVGPFAPSTINLALISFAFASVITPWIAAGTSRSTFNVRIEFLSISSPPVNPLRIFPLLAANFMAASISIPLALK